MIILSQTEVPSGSLSLWETLWGRRIFAWFGCQDVMSTALIVHATRVASTKCLWWVILNSNYPNVNNVVKLRPGFIHYLFSSASPMPKHRENMMITWHQNVSWLKKGSRIFHLDDLHLQAQAGRMSIKLLVKLPCNWFWSQRSLSVPRAD